MNKLNWIFTLTSINVLAVTIERFSFTGKVFLNPNHFLRLHELVQMTTLILFTVLLPIFILREVSHNFKAIQHKHYFFCFLLFIAGIYFYSTGNGLHEVSSFNLNAFCIHRETQTCKTFYINDYYTGNILYFIGAAFSVISLLIFEKSLGNKQFDKKNLFILMINSFFYAVAIFAYAAFDPVLIGLLYSVVISVIADGFFLVVRKSYRHYPFISYTALSYTLGTVCAIFLRLHS